MDAYIDLLFCEFNLYTQFNNVFFELQYIVQCTYQYLCTP